jgi:hypothetical protein
MEKHQLAEELRQRQYALGRVERRLIDALTDDEMIDCYVTCSGCGERQVEGEALDRTIAAASDAGHFLELCDAAASRRYKRHHMSPRLHQGAPRKVKHSRARLN